MLVVQVADLLSHFYFFAAQNNLTEEYVMLITCLMHPRMWILRFTWIGIAD